MVVAVALLALMPAAGFAKSAKRRVLVDPTPLRLVEPYAATATSDGERFVVVTFPTRMRRPVEVHDTFTGRRISLPLGCIPRGSIDSTKWLNAGRGMFTCTTPVVVRRLIDLATGATVLDLPASLEAGGQRFDDPRYIALGRRWIASRVDCPGYVSCAYLYYDYRTGETRLNPYDTAPEHRSSHVYRDLDARDLPLRRASTAPHSPHHATNAAAGERPARGVR